jgi:hypothetical protein
MFRAWDMIEASDTDLHEAHPNNNIPHTHSMTRIIVRKSDPARKVEDPDV